MKRITAFLTSAVMLGAAMPAFPVSAEYSTIEDAEFVLPDWVPDTFEEAMEFCNTYGETRAADGVYCIVDRWDSALGPKCDETLTVGSAERVCENVIRYEPKDGLPDLSQMSEKERAEWEARLEEQSAIEAHNKNVYYFVSVWKPTQPAYCEITRRYWFQAGGTIAEPQTYSFQVATDALHVAESGWRAVVPDCITEYEAFKQEHGSFYACDNILVLADTVNYSTGADMKMQVKQGNVTLDPDGGFNCREQSMGPEKAGSSEKIVQYYQIKSGITATLEASIKHTTSSGSVTVENAYYKCMRSAAGGLYLEPYDPDPSVMFIPDWVPDSYESAIAFQNAYGTTHAEDGLFCTVKRINADRNAIKAKTEVAAGSPECELVFDRMLVYEPVIADPNPNATPEQKAAFERWVQEQAIIGSYNQDVTYYVTLWKPEQPGNVTLNETLIMPDSRQHQTITVQDTYTFTTADDVLYTAETGWRAYVPDCVEEYAAFVQENGAIAGSGPYLICSAVNNSSVGSKMFTLAELNNQQLNPVGRLDCTAIALTPPPAGSRESMVDYYLVEDEGKVYASVQITGDGKQTEQNLKAIRNTAGSIFLVKDGDAVISDIASDVPSWVPDSFETAIDFLNLNGEVKCGTDAKGRNGMFCLCKMNQSPKRYSYEPSDYIDDGANYEEVGRWVFGQGERSVSVFLYRALTQGKISLEWIQNDVPTLATDALKTIRTGKIHEFVAASDLSVKEVGLNAMLPDGWYEANAFAQKNGGISLHDIYQENYIVCCGSFNLMTGYEMAAELAGSGKLDAVTEYDIVLEHVTDPLEDGGEIQYRVIVFKPAEKGIVKFNQLFPRTFPSSERLVKETKYYNVEENGTVTEIKIRKGDVNGDTDITTADLVLALKFMGGQLTGSNALTETQMFAADVLNDNCLNAADISTLKRIIMQIKNPPPPEA